MRRLAILLVVAALMSPTAASGQNYTFGDWARDQAYSPGDAMPEEVYVEAFSPRIDSLDGIGEFDWNTTPTILLNLSNSELSSIESGAFSGLTSLWYLTMYDSHQLSSIESGAFSGLTSLLDLWVSESQLSSIESGAFSGLPNLTDIHLWNNQLSSIVTGAFSELTNLEELDLQYNMPLTELNLAEADFPSLINFNVAGNANIASVSLKNAVVNQSSFAALLDGGEGSQFGEQMGIGELDGINELDLSGVDFVDITDLEPLYVMDDLVDLWLVDTENLDAVDLDELLDNLETIEGTDVEGILFMTQANFDGFNAAGGGLLAAWHAEPGHHVAFGPERVLGDLNLDGEVNGLDVDPFVDVLLNGPYWPEADMNEDGRVNGLDVDPFVVALDGGGTQQTPEPSTLFLTLVALGVVGGWRKWRRAA